MSLNYLIKDQNLSKIKQARYLYELNDFVPGAKKILYLVADFFGCGWYRGQVPASFLNSIYSNYINIVISNYLSDSDVTNSVWDIIVLQRQESEQVLNLIKKSKAILVYEIDDDIFNVHPTSSTAYSIYSSNDILKRIREFLSLVDAVTVSTKNLKDIMTIYNKNVKVLPNFINTDYIKTIRKKKEDYYKDEIVLGWAGSATHYIDLKEIEQVIIDILKENKNVKFYMGGVKFPFFNQINPDQIIYGEWQYNILDYYKSLTKIDIGLCPLAPIKFNDSKSNIKYLEFGSLGIPVIASTIAPYKETIKDGKTGILIKTSGNLYKDWKKEIIRLIKDPKLRHFLGVNAAQFVDNNYSHKKIIPQWFEFYNYEIHDLYAQKKGVQNGNSI